MLCWTNLYDIQASSLSHYVLLLIALFWGKFHKIILFSILFFMYRCTCCFKTRPSPRSSLQTQGQSVGLGERARRKISSTGERAPGVPTHQAISKNSSGCRLLIGHKKCFVLLCPIGEQFLLSSFREFVHDGYCLDHGLSGSCTEEMHAVRKLSVWYKLSISICCLPKN